MILIYEPSIQGKFLFVNRKLNGYHKRRGSSAKFRSYPEPFSLKILIRNFCVCTLARRQRGHQPLFSGFYRRPRTSSPSSHPGSSAICICSSLALPDPFVGARSWFCLYKILFSTICTSVVNPDPNWILIQ